MTSHVRKEADNYNTCYEMRTKYNRNTLFMTSSGRFVLHSINTYLISTVRHPSLGLLSLSVTDIWGQYFSVEGDRPVHCRTLATPLALTRQKSGAPPLSFSDNQKCPWHWQMSPGGHKQPQGELLLRRWECNDKEDEGLSSWS